MTSSLPRRWLLAALFLVFVAPLSALAQTAELAVQIQDLTTVTAGVPASIDFQVQNNGPDTANNVAVDFSASTLPAGVSFAASTPPVGSFDPNTGIWTVGTLATGPGPIISLQLDIASSTADGANVTISGTASADETDPGANPNTAADDFTVVREVDIRVLISEAVGGDPYFEPVVAGSNAPNPNANYFVRVRNFGPSDATNIVIDTSTTLPTDVTVDSISEQTGTYTGDASGNGQWTIPSLAADTPTALELYLIVGPSAPEGTTDLSMSASLNSVDETETGEPEPNSALAETEITREVNFDLVVDCFPDSVIAGGGTGNLECTLDFTQNGPSQASNVNVNLTLPAGVTVDSAIVSGAASTFNLPTNWSLGTKNPGESSTALLTMTVDATATGDLTISAAATANETIVNGPVSDDDLVASEAAAAGATTFLTTIGFTNGYPGEVTVMISCNNGTPLEQDFEISAGTPVDFVVDVLDFVAPDVNCEVTLVAVDDGYVGSFLANGVDTGDSCFFASEPEAGEAFFDTTAERMNTCEITAEPVASTFEVEKVWEFEGDDIVGLVAGIEIWCAPASTTTGPDYGTVSTFRYFEGDGSFGLGFYPHWNGATTCYAAEPDVDSSVESDNGCAAGTDFAVGDDEKGCVITNTVFFEGIPTLSQYGLALMALLMLGVGFVGLRRFV